LIPGSGGAQCSQAAPGGAFSPALPTISFHERHRRGYGGVIPCRSLDFWSRKPRNIFQQVMTLRRRYIVAEHESLGACGVRYRAAIQPACDVDSGRSLRLGRQPISIRDRREVAPFRTEIGFDCNHGSPLVSEHHRRAECRGKNCARVGGREVIARSPWPTADPPSMTRDTIVAPTGVMRFSHSRARFF